MSENNTTVQAVYKIAQLVKKHGGRCLLVGGCVRDELQGLPGKDYDLEVYGLDAMTINRVIGKEFPLDPVGMSFGVFKVHHLDIDIAMPRRESKTGIGHRGFMVQSIADLTFAEAAARRDFTINAIMKDPLTGEIIDPWQGQADLKAGILRHVSSHFSEDPLRVLRAMQFAGRFEFAVATETVDLCAQLSQNELPVERIGSEWSKLLLKGKKPSSGLNFLRACNWIRYYPELAALIGCEQTPLWHPEGDVWNHTMGAIDAAAELRSGNENDDLVLMVAALCHDFGKPATSVVNEKGHITSKGHDQAGIAPAKKFISRIWRQNDLPEKALPLIGGHMMLFSLVTQNASDKAFRKLALAVKRMDLLAKVAVSDIMGTQKTSLELKKYLDQVEIFKARAAELEISAKTPQPLIMGRHLLSRGYSPGPEVGKILRCCFEAQLAGEFTDNLSAMEFLDANYPGPCGN